MIQNVFLSTHNVGTIIEIHRITFGMEPTPDDLISYSKILGHLNKARQQR